MRSLTVLWKSLILTVTLSSLAACSSSPYQSSSTTRPTVIPTHHGQSLAVDAIQYLYITGRYGLSKEQKYKQTAAIHTALNSTYGKVVHWYESDAMGAVKAVHGYPQGRGYCRVLFSAITVKGRTREFTETACVKNYEDDMRWYFVKK